MNFALLGAGYFWIPINTLELFAGISYLEAVWSFQVLLLSFVKCDQSSIWSGDLFFSPPEVELFNIHALPNAFTLWGFSLWLIRTDPIPCSVWALRIVPEVLSGGSLPRLWAFAPTHVYAEDLRRGLSWRGALLSGIPACRLTLTFLDLRLRPLHLGTASQVLPVHLLIVWPGNFLQEVF